MRYGKEKEIVAIQQYEHAHNVTVDGSGLLISDRYPYLGASPDGLIGDDLVVEVKCPYASRTKLITHTTVPYLKVVDGLYELDKKT